MNTVSPANQWAQLIKRRAEMAMTLRHVEFEQRDIEAKEASMDRDARASRLSLLRDLNEWYSHEISQVDQELQRVGTGNPGLCIACGAPISPLARATYNRADLCAECQNSHKQL